MWSYAAKIWQTLAPHLSRHPNGISEEDWFWLEERRKRVRGNDRGPSREEPHKLRGSTNSRKQRAYIEANVPNGFIQRLSPTAAPISFEKKDGRLRLCVDYRALNIAPECLSPKPNQGRRRVRHRAKIPIRGVKSSAEQRPLKRGMSLPERNSSHTMTLPEPKSAYNDPTGGAGMKVQSALNDREVQRR
jgi:hypothetical protein